MMTHELQNPRMGVYVEDFQWAARLIVWDADEVPASLAKVHFDADAALVLQANANGLDLEDLAPATLEDGEERVVAMPWHDREYGTSQVLCAQLRLEGDWIEWRVQIALGTSAAGVSFDEPQAVFRAPLEATARAYQGALTQLGEVRHTLARIPEAGPEGDWEAWSASDQEAILGQVIRAPGAPTSALVRVVERAPILRRHLWGRASVPPEVFSQFWEPSYHWGESLVRHEDVPTPLLERISELGPPGLRDMARAVLAERAVEEEGVGAAFGELRSLLTRPGGAERWEHLCGFLEKAWMQEPEVVGTTWVPYARRALDDAWEDEVREVPKAWASALGQEAPGPLWSLARKLTVQTSRLAGAQNLAGTPHLESLRRLRLEIARGTRGWLDAFGATPMPSLCWLNVMCFGGSEPLEARDFLQAPWWSGVRELFWHGGHLEDEDFEQMTQALGRPERVEFSSTGLDAVRLEAFFLGAWVEGLQALSLRGHSLREGLVGLCAAPLGALEELSLENEMVDLETLEALLEAPWMAGVTRLRLGYNPEIGDRAVDLLWAHAEHLQGLRGRRAVAWTGLTHGAYERLVGFLERE